MSAAAPESCRSRRSPSEATVSRVDHGTGPCFRSHPMKFAVRSSACLLVALSAAVASAAPSVPSLLDAARNGDRAALRALLQNGANVNAAEPDGTTALHWTSYRDDGEGTGLLIKAGANLNARNDLGATPLWVASFNGSDPLVRQLLAAGADPNLALLAGESPLMAAARAGKPLVVAQLLEKGAVVNAHGARDQTALMWAASQKHPD